MLASLHSPNKHKHKANETATARTAAAAHTHTHTRTHAHTYTRTHTRVAPLTSGSWLILSLSFIAHGGTTTSTLLLRRSSFSQNLDSRYSREKTHRTTRALRAKSSTRRSHGSPLWRHRMHAKGSGNGTMCVCVRVLCAYVRVLCAYVHLSLPLCACVYLSAPLCPLSLCLSVCLCAIFCHRTPLRHAWLQVLHTYPSIIESIQDSIPLFLRHSIILVMNSSQILCLYEINTVLYMAAAKQEEGRAQAGKWHRSAAVCNKASPLTLATSVDSQQQAHHHQSSIIHLRATSASSPC